MIIIISHIRCVGGMVFLNLRRNAISVLKGGGVYVDESHSFIYTVKTVFRH